jgi:hypothetical protein
MVDRESVLSQARQFNKKRRHIKVFPYCWLDLVADGEFIGTLVFELFGDVP